MSDDAQHTATMALINVCKATFSALVLLEWSAKSATAPSYMGGPSLGWLPSCPICRGIDPSSRWKGEFVESAIGHRGDCALARVMYQSLAEEQ